MCMIWLIVFSGNTSEYPQSWSLSQTTYSERDTSLLNVFEEGILRQVYIDLRDT